MTIWTTFCPRKLSWELTAITSRSKAASSDWQKNILLIEDSLKLLRTYGISGIRLVIFPEELTTNGKQFDWHPIETMLVFCAKYKLDVDLCIGPFQYPHYPGIYLPKDLLQYVFNNTRSLDTTPVLREYGDTFLEKQLDRYGLDKRIRGFHLANEWPDGQRVAGRESVKAWISAGYMLHVGKFVKKQTTKPISLNTNIDASDKRKLATVFGEILEELEDQARLGFDIYPSQETWRKAFWQKLRRLVEPYQRSFQWSRKKFALCEIYFCEVEAQPWGNGQSWQRIIANEPRPEEKVLQYSRQSLPKTFEKYIKPCKPYEISLWGSDFWLSAHKLGITWPLEQVKALR